MFPAHNVAETPSARVGSAQQKRYKSAPIVEAVIEIRIHPQESFNLDLLAELAGSMKSEYPNQAPMHMLEMGIALQDPEPKMTSSRAPVGYRLARADGSRILQIRRDGLAYSHMAPYTEWATFQAEAKPLWERFRGRVSDSRLARCALRYINRVDVLGESVEIHDYFRLYPEVPKELPQEDVSGMAMNLVMPQKDIDCVAVINQSLAPVAKQGHVSFILDIDVFRQGIETWGDSQVWEFLGRLRDRKNQIFEACITDRTRKLIDQ